MKVYFGASITLDRSMLPVYKRIVSELKKQGHTVLSEYVVDSSLKPGAGLTSKKLFARETKTIDKADVMVAEVTSPSWGTAFLMEHALEQGKPVLALFYKESQHSLPMMIEGHPELYVEHYDEDNVGVLIKKNLAHLRSMKNKKGQLVVIDGTDGSGKGTQTRKLLQYLKEKRVSTKYIDFPRYYTSFHGGMVGKFLAGEYGSREDVNPYLASLIYALDRLTARDEMVDWLDKGNVVVANRYTVSNAAFQGARVPLDERRAFLRWLYDMEYKEHKLPKEDVVIFLHVPVEASQKLLKKKEKSEARRYLKGKKDINEADLDYQRRVLALYKQLVKKYNHWVMIDCVDKSGKLLSIKVVHEKILKVLRERGVVEG